MLEETRLDTVSPAGGEVQALEETKGEGGEWYGGGIMSGINFSQSFC